MKRTLATILSGCAIGLIALVAPPTASPDQPTDAQPKWVPLFNGHNLDGWTPKFAGHPLGENLRNTFRVENGILRVVYDDWDSFDGAFGHLFYKTPFSHYRLRIEYRFLGTQTKEAPGWAFRNSGIMIHGQPPETMALDQDFPVSIEVQLLGGDGEHERPNANLCTPGTNVVMDGKLITQHCTNANAPTFQGDQWVTIEVEVHGGQLIRHIVGGKTVLEYQSPQLDRNDPDAKKLIVDDQIMLDGGSISLQAESHPVEFRRVEIMLLEE